MEDMKQDCDGCVCIRISKHESLVSLLEHYMGQERFTSEKKHKNIDKSLFDIGPTMQMKTGHIHVSIQAGKGPSCLVTQIFLPRLWFGTVITTPTISKTHLSKNLTKNNLY